MRKSIFQIYKMQNTFATFYVINGCYYSNFIECSKNVGHSMLSSDEHF